MKLILIFLAAFLNTNYALTLAPLLQPDGGYPIKDQYIVVLNPSLLGTQHAHQELRIWLETQIATSPGSKIIHSYQSIGAFAVRMKSSLLEEVRQRPEISFVEKDTLVHVWDHLLKTRPASKVQENGIVKAHDKLATLTQNNAPWGLCRISKQKKQTRQTTRSYIYPRNAGQGVDVYVIDTGIYTKHAEFEGRAKWGITIPANDFDIDANGHGTHCAGIIAGKTFGVAKKATVIAVKALRSNGFGTNSDVIKGIEWVVNQHRMHENLGKKSIINMSLGGSRSFALDLITRHAIKLGIPLTVAAGNDLEDACNYSPASVPDAITVGAINRMDGMAFFSNFGKCVDLFAPGVDILSAWIGKPNAVQLLSGTSMATPHVAGVMALYLAEQKLTPGELKKIILTTGVSGILKGIPVDTPNNLVSIISLLQSQNPQ